jgi:ribosome-associated translation inhibitor RaiA
MQILINTGHNIEGGEALIANFRGAIESALDRFSDRITRAEVHLSDENGQKHGADDKRCMIEARLEGHQPLAVTHHAAALDQAVDGASDKLARLIEHTLGRLHDPKAHNAGHAQPEPMDRE